MEGPGDPPEGTPEGAPGGGDEEYRSVVFDESFVRAARLQESSARERLGDHAPAVRTRHAWARLGASRQLLLLVLLIALAFGTAVYMGLRHPYKEPRPPSAEPLQTTVIPLAPRGTVPGGPADRLFAGSPAQRFGEGADGVTLPDARRTQNFSEGLVMAALATAKEYTVRSALDRAVLGGGDGRAVRVLLAPSQLDQYDRSFEHPAADGQHAITGWLVRFDPAQVALDDAPVRVEGAFSLTEVSPAALEVSADHTFVYAVRPAAVKDGKADASLFTVRRILRFRFDRDDLQDHHLQVLQSTVQAGPESCGADDAAYLRPLLAGRTADNSRQPATDPYATGRPAGGLCGVLAPGPMVPAGGPAPPGR
ncbi:SCO2583 family membrane protein [Streptomyces huiliensis]|uniref:SCO2583 family membrane protein n=1 Tax=Streptomyces huiliensis TaxID=2876027 RepID=UPI001CBCE31F|nr:hypothetical protein [Streptomyces huiliensis]MBZ4318161.1 hypothetical protein [Streptomyces huiliensis]